ncbi:hypothetical protein LSH36_1000g00038 [Paralvinella palmiformis]|uniref:CBS domain-containing protein n=1 Tax=Paralvinella palmiformis TaxID=53620 RepID=A0AAD9IXE9_9ANNE|nr:hypothetical protein LSH36_1000g00038 [Paralvinella palmiformis]
MTISLTVILLECTGDITFGLPIVMVLIIAKWVGDLFNSVMNTPVISLRAVEQVSRIVEVLENMPHLHSGFPVVDNYDPEQAEKEAVFGRCKGLILRSQLCLLVRYKVFVDNTDAEQLHTASRPSKELRLEDFRDFFSQSQCTNFKLTDEDKSKLIDLTPYMNPTPYTVTMNASLPRMFRLFRGLGLRHLITVNEKNEVVGMVTRKDIAKYRMSAKGGSLTVQELHIHHD